MASPVNDTYTVGSGKSIFAGRFEPIPNTIVLVGDSLTDMNLGNISPYTVTNGINGGLLKEIGNIGVYGNTVGQMLARIDNSYTNVNPGLAGFGTIGWIEFRGGTNNARSSAITPTIISTYDALFAKLLSYAGRVFVKPVPPIGGPEAASNANVPSYNTYLQAKCAASGGKLIWVDDCVNMKDMSGNQISTYFVSDGVHFSNAGVYRMAVDGAATILSTISPYNYISPISTDPLDKYPATNQWIPNHTNIGTGGSFGNLSGTVPNNWGLWGNGGGMIASASIVNADVSDPNQTKWIRVTPSQVNASTGAESFQLTTVLSGRTITTTDPSKLDFIVQIRLNNLNTTNFSKLTCWVQGGSGNFLVRPLEAKFGGSGIISNTLVLRHCLDRHTATNETTETLYLNMQVGSTGNSNLGSFDVRCVTVRG